MHFNYWKTTICTNFINDEIAAFKIITHLYRQDNNSRIFYILMDIYFFSLTKYLTNIFITDITNIDKKISLTYYLQLFLTSISRTRHNFKVQTQEMIFVSSTNKL